MTYLDFSVDANGNRTNAVLETFGNLSVNPNAKSPQGDSIYYPNVNFQIIIIPYWMDHNDNLKLW